jgi:hypothetical protein
MCRYHECWQCNEEFGDGHKQWFEGYLFCSDDCIDKYCKVEGFDKCKVCQIQINVNNRLWIQGYAFCNCGCSNKYWKDNNLNEDDNDEHSDDLEPW